MNAKLLLVVAAFAVFSTPAVHADAPKKAPAKKAESKADADTLPFYGKVTAVTTRTLTIVRGESAEAGETKMNLTSSTEYVNGEKPAAWEAVKVGAWVGGAVKKAADGGNDTVLKINVGVKQKAAEKGKSKTPSKKKGEPKKKEEPKKKAAESKKKGE